MALAVPRGWETAPLSAEAHLARAVSAHLEVERGAARRHAALGAAALGDQPLHELQVAASFLQAASDVDAGGSPFEELRRIRAAWERAGDAVIGPALHPLVVPTEMRVALLVGDHRRAAAAAQRLTGRFPGSGEAAVVTALLEASSGRGDAARRTLAPVLGGAASCHVRLTVVTARLLEATLAAGRGDEYRAFDATRRGLAAAVDGSLVRPFLEAGPEVHGVLVVNVGRFGRQEAFVARVLAAFADRHDPLPLLGALTAAELEILSDLPSLATLPEIAAARCISVNTVKTHLRGVYRKLGVSGRRGAVEEARRRALL